MSQTRAQVLKESRTRGVVAGSAAAIAVALGVTGSVGLALVATLPTAILGWRWWAHRAENGIRF